MEGTVGILRSYTKNISKNKFIAELIKTLEELHVSFSKNQYLTEYKERMSMLRKDVVVINNGKKINAKIINIYSDGGLKIKKENGYVEKIYAGEASVYNVHE